MAAVVAMSAMTLAGPRVEDEQMTLAVARRVVVAGGHQHDPALRTRLRDHRLAERVPDVVRDARGRRCVGELPQHLASRLALSLARGRIGDVERIEARAAGGQPAHQDGVPVRTAAERCGAVEVDIPHGRGAVHGELVRVQRIGERIQPRIDDARHVRPQLVAVAGVEGVQHAVVGALVDGLLARGDAAGEGVVAGVGVGGDGACDEHRFGGDDVAEQVAARAVGAALQGAIAAQAVDHGIGVGLGRGVEQRLVAPRRSSRAGTGCRAGAAVGDDLAVGRVATRGELCRAPPRAAPPGVMSTWPVLTFTG